MNYPILIVGAVVDVQQLTMYRADGETIVMQQGDPRIRDLVAKLAPALETGDRTYWLTVEDMSGRNHYAVAEKKTSGLVRFFKVAKSKLKEIAEKFLEPLVPMELGVKPEAPVHKVNGMEPIEDEFCGSPSTQLPKEEHRPLTKSAEAVAEIMANAVNSSDAGFGKVNEDKGSEETIVAITEDNTVIPGVEQMSVQMQAVSESVGSGEGMTKFFQRAGMVKRGHSVEDLLKFIQKGELPLADDGSVLVYKRLQSTGVEGVFVDVHSGRVKQRVGSFVHMAESMVDPNRGQDCSNGLHVARRDYLTAFSGDVTVLAKLAPEDVIAVPQYDARKLRAKAYHIIAVLSKEDARLVCSNKPMQDTKLLADAVAGNHVGILEYVEITASKGGGLVITKAEDVGTVPQNETREVHSLDLLAGQSEESSQVDARALALDLAKPGSEVTAVTTLQGDQIIDVQHIPAGETEQVRKIVDQINERYQAPPAGMTVKSEPIGEAAPVPSPQLVSAVVPNSTKRPVDFLATTFILAQGKAKLVAARGLLNYKKQCKKSWAALGVSIDVWELATKLVAEDATAAEPLPKVVPPNDDKHFPILRGDNSGLPDKPAKVKKAAPARPVVQPTPPVAKAAPAKKEGKMTQQEEMAKLVELYNNNPDKPNARAIFAFKQKAKKSWDVLGVTDVKFQKKITERAKL